MFSWFRRKKKEASIHKEAKVDRKFYFEFRSADGTMRVRHSIWRSDLQLISDQLAVCAACPQISSLVLQAAGEDRKCTS